MDLYSEAVKWVWAGIGVIPVNRASKRPIIKWSQYRDKLPDANQLELWFRTWRSNLGVIMGWRNLIVLDFDTMDAFDLWVPVYGQHTDTYTVGTTRGLHLYYFLRERWERNFRTMDIDLKANGFVLAPPSVHPTGKIYKVLNDTVIKEVDSIESLLPAGVIPDDNGRSTESIPVSQVIMDPWLVAENPTRSPSNNDSQVAQIKRTLRIEDMFASVVITGKRYQLVLCPFHDDHDPSGWIDTEKQLFGCYACKFRPMDIINLYARLNNLTNVDAIKELAKKI